MSKMSDEPADVYNLMEKGELEKLDSLNQSPLPSPSRTESSAKGLFSKVESRPSDQLATSWLSQWRGNVTNWSQLMFTSKEKNKGRGSIVRTFEDCPLGYPRLAAFVDSDENFMLYRRFGFLQARIILYKQDRLRELEEQLIKMDKRDAESNPKILKSRGKDDAQSEDRKILIQTITSAFNEYAELLKSAHELAGYNRAPARDYESVKRYFNMTDPLRNNESYIYHKEDIITLKPGRETAWLDAVVEKALQKLSCPLVRQIFCSEDLRRKTDPKQTRIILYSRARINCAVSFIITLVILALLIVPVYILWHITSLGTFDNRTTAVIIGILLVFTLVFSGVLSLFTRAKRHEILAAAAGYCAVLVVFIGNISQLSSSKQ